MTVRQAYQDTIRLLREGQVEEPDSQAHWLFSHFFGLSRPQRALHAGDLLSDEKLRLLRQAITRRIAGEPLQYILGEWTFMDIPLKVGPGVLIPRDDTEVCVRSCIERLQIAGLVPGRILDLCAGSGAIALAMADRYPEAEVTALEAMPEAFAYLRQNCSAFPAVRPTAGDLFTDFRLFPESYFDVILSNPPYIASKELSSLPREVQQEPAAALDGGEDGLRFYRAIVSCWLPRLRPGGVLSLEIGEDQAEAVMSLLAHAGADSPLLHRDLSGLPRCVTAQRPQASASATGLSRNSTDMTI